MAEEESQNPFIDEVGLSERSYLLCVEPESLDGNSRQFAINLGTGQACPIIMNDKGCQSGIMNRIKREEFKIDALINRKEKQSYWNY